MSFLLKNKKIIIASLGNVVEWFDFGLFIFMAPILGAQFFPAESPLMATINALIVFATGFLCRPFGGILFGYFGDTQGRTKVLKISIILITLSTLLVGLLPSYKTAGFITPVLFVLLRLIQGLSIGGEYSGVMIFLAESAPKNKRGFFTSFAATGANLGFLLATLSLVLLNLLFSPEIIKNWAWRLPFILVGLPGTYVIYYRFKLAETHIYTQLQKNQQIQTQPLITAIQYAPYQLLKIFGLTCMSATFYYVFFGNMPHYLEHYLGFLSNDVLIIQLGLIMLMLFLVPLAGILGDYLSRKTMLIIVGAAIILMVWPCFYLFQTHSIGFAIIAWGIATIISSLDQGNSLTAIVENCPANVRYSGIAFSYNLGMALFGGTTPLIITLFIEHISLFAPAYYLMLMASISLITATRLVPNNLSVEPLTRSKANLL